MRELVIDTETTGLSFKEDRVVEIGIVELRNHIPTGETFHRYVNPCKHVGYSEKIHRLSDYFLRDQPAFKVIAQEILDFIRKDTLIAHNASFDRGMLCAEFARLNIPDLPNPWVDTLELAKKVKDPRKRGRTGLTLDALCARFGVDTSQRKQEGHGALLDARLLAQVYLGLRGGSQFGLQMTTEAPPAPEAMRVVAGPRRFVSRLSEAERALHAAHVAEIDQVARTHRRGLKGNDRKKHIALLGRIKGALWSQYP